MTHNQAKALALGQAALFIFSHVLETDKFKKEIQEYIGFCFTAGEPTSCFVNTEHGSIVLEVPFQKRDVLELVKIKISNLTDYKYEFPYKIPPVEFMKPCNIPKFHNSISSFDLSMEDLMEVYNFNK